MPTIRSRSVAALASGVLLLAPLAGCGGDDDPKAASGPTDATSSPSATGSPDAATPSASPSAAAGETVSVRAFVADLTKAMKFQKSVHMSVAGTGAVSLEADVRYGDDPAIRLQTSISGQDVSLIIVDRVLYMEAGSSGKFIKVPKDDPGYAGVYKAFENFGPQSSVKGIETAITGVRKVGSEQVDGRSLTRYDVTVDTSRTAGAFSQLAGASGGARTMTLQFFLDRNGLVHQVAVEAAGQSVTMTFQDWGKPVRIKAPTGEALIASPGV